MNRLKFFFYDLFEESTGFIKTSIPEFQHYQLELPGDLFFNKKLNYFLLNDDNLTYNFDNFIINTKFGKPLKNSSPNQSKFFTNNSCFFFNDYWEYFANNSSILQILSETDDFYTNNDFSTSVSIKDSELDLNFAEINQNFNVNDKLSASFYNNYENSIKNFVDYNNFLKFYNNSSVWQLKNKNNFNINNLLVLDAVSNDSDLDEYSYFYDIDDDFVENVNFKPISENNQKTKNFSIFDTIFNAPQKLDYSNYVTNTDLQTNNLSSYYNFILKKINEVGGVNLSVENKQSYLNFNIYSLLLTKDFLAKQDHKDRNYEISSILKKDIIANQFNIFLGSFFLDSFILKNKINIFYLKKNNKYITNNQKTYDSFNFNFNKKKIIFFLI